MSFGLDLLRMYLATTFPHAKGPPEYAEWSDVQSIFFELCKSALPAAQSEGRRWHPSSVEALDGWLMDISNSGQFAGDMNIPKGTAEEMYRRCRYALIASMLEEEAGKPLHMPFPSDIPNEAKGWGLMLFILGGPARDYPRDIVEKL